MSKPLELRLSLNKEEKGWKKKKKRSSDFDLGSGQKDVCDLYRYKTKDVLVLLPLRIFTNPFKLAVTSGNQSVSTESTVLYFSVLISFNLNFHRKIYNIYLRCFSHE